jgi:hypothetical protein
MPHPRLKLKQASTVLQVQPKELQNLVQFGVVKPKLSSGAYVFDSGVLLSAKIALYLKEVLGTRASVLAKWMAIFNASAEKFASQNPSYLVFSCRLAQEPEPIRVSVPFRALGEKVTERINRTELYRDLPPGRKRAGWKKEFLHSLSEAAQDLGEISEEEIARTVRTYRKEKRAPEITVAAED